MSAALCAVCLAGSASASAQDLIGTVQQALAFDAGLAAARAQFEASQQAIPIARAALLPRIDAGWGRSWNRISVEDYPRQAYWQNGWTATLSQPLFDWAAWTGYQQSQVVVAKAALSLAEAQQTLLLQTATAYFDVLAAEADVARADRYARLLDRHLASIRQRALVGEATQVDVDDALAGLRQGQLQAVLATDERLLKRQALDQVIGAEAGPLADLPGDTTLPAPADQSADHWLALARTQAWPVQVQTLNQKLAALEVSRITAGHYPVVALTASHTPAGAGGGYALPTTTSTAMLQVSVPLYAGGRVLAQTREAEALRTAADATLQNTIRKSTALTREHHARLRQRLAQSSALQRLAGVQIQSLTSTRMGYQTGSRSSTDVLRATDMVAATQRDLIASRYGAVQSLLQLEAAVGGLDLDKLRQLDLLLTGAPGSPARPDVDAGLFDISSPSAAEGDARP